jgi:chromate transporter
MAHIQFLDSCVLAFMIYGTVQMLKWMKITALNVSLLVGIGVLGYLLRNPWFFPIGVLVGFTVSGFWGTSDVAKTNGSAIKIKWGNLILFLSIFSLFGMGSLYLKKYQKSNTNPIVLFENSYRLGSLSFGGGNVLAAMTMEQYVHHKNRLSMDELNLGIAMTQSSPGPNFNLSVFTNALAMQNHQSGIWQFIIGALVGFVGIFLPGTIIVFFTFPIWQHIQSNRFIQKAIPGIFSVSIGFILSACLVLADNLITKFTVTNNATPALFSMTVLILCLVMLFTKKIPTPFVVLFSLAFGWFVG